MEIIHLILGKANPERMNGVNKVVYQLATNQATSGRKVQVWGITKELTDNYGERAFSTKLFQAHKNPFAMDSILKKSLLEIKNDIIVHLHGGWIPVYATISRFLHKHNIPFVITPHGAYNIVAMQRSGASKKLYFTLFEKRLLQRAKKIHSIGQSEVDGLNSIFKNNKSFLLPYGYDGNGENYIKPLDSNEFVIGFVGRLDIHTKGLDLLVNSFAKLNKEFPKTKLWIVGDSDERPKLQKMIDDLEISNNVKLWGKRFGKDKDKVMLQMNIFTHPSRNEGLPSAVLEAAEMGIPSVVSYATNVASYIDNNKAGISVGNDNVEELYQAFKELYNLWNNDKLKPYSDNAKKMVYNEFSWKILTAKFDKLYK